jgi:hypothetical protein
MPRRFDRMEDVQHEIALIISTADEAGYATGYDPSRAFGGHATPVAIDFAT